MKFLSSRGVKVLPTAIIRFGFDLSEGRCMYLCGVLYLDKLIYAKRYCSLL